MHPPLTPESKAFWLVVTSKSKRYPYWCKTSVISPVAEAVSHRAFQCVDIPHEEFRYWGFEDIEKRNEFQRRYSALNWST